MRTQWAVIVSWEKLVTEGEEVISCEQLGSELIALCQSEDTAEEIYRKWERAASDDYVNEFKCDECL